MKQFIGGLMAGILLSLFYVHWGWRTPDILNLPKMLRGNIVSTSVDEILYDFRADPVERRRAQEVFFENRAKFASEIDQEYGNPFLGALQRHRAMHEARQLSSSLSANQEALKQPALRAALERKYATTETQSLLDRMAQESLSRQPYLMSWMDKEGLSVEARSLRGALARIAQDGRPPQK